MTTRSFFQILRLPVFVSLFALTLGVGVSVGQDQVLPQLDNTFSGFGEPDEKVSLSANFWVDESGKTGTLHVTADMIPDWYVYSVGHEPGGPKPTVIGIDKDFKQAKVIGIFEPDQEPERKFDGIFNMDTETHFIRVTWSAKIEFVEGIDPATLEIPVVVNGQTCSIVTKVCMQFKSPANLIAKAVAKPATTSYEFRPEGTHAKVRGWIQPRQAAPGQKITLYLELVPDPSWRVYDYMADPVAGINSTLIFLKKTNDLVPAKPSASAQPLTVDLENGKQAGVYEELVTWTIPFTLPKRIKAGSYELPGEIGFQTFQGSIGDEPVAVSFSADFVVADAEITERQTLSFFQPENSDYATLSKAVQRAADSAKQPLVGSFAGLSVPAVMGLAFLAGLILNIMPCVLPVIGLKILSFVQQGGESPRRILLLNLTFAAGMMAIFLLLATLAVLFNIGWGGLFQSFAFKVTMIAVVFAFGLSFLGVWEIPIPGFVATGSASKAAEREGYTGAFTKGILTTLLATPCSGPLLIPAVTWALNQPPVLTYLAFTSLGLGMASPYIVIGAFPALVGMLPRPGAWMETFKQLMGFVMMGTAVFLFGAIEAKYAVSVLTLLVVIGVSCWVIGRISLTSPFKTRAFGWVSATSLVLVGVYFAFFVLIPQHELPWKPYSQALLEKTIEDGNPVFIDFTAHW